MTGSSASALQSCYPTIKDLNPGLTSANQAKKSINSWHLILFCSFPLQPKAYYNILLKWFLAHSCWTSVYGFHYLVPGLNLQLLGDSLLINACIHYTTIPNNMCGILIQWLSHWVHKPFDNFVFFLNFSFFFKPPNNFGFNKRING